ncbi:hypothetical protein INT43_003291 [Umbelopsis isabellina]|uniref:DH domain-containing protein n=1 Tax=Mortierella isabellina TaxID=91625 RepID=A0A8H7PPZ8_MORIS|nr:hypothetical protein INT43_003291 [Umbelopsis isabellina]
MTISQVDAPRAVTAVHTPKERTRTRSAPYSFAMGRCGPTCTCDIFGLDGHSSPRLNGCATFRTKPGAGKRSGSTTDAMARKIENNRPIAFQTHEVVETTKLLATAETAKMPSKVITKEISKTLITNVDIRPSSITKKTPVAHQPVHELLETEQDYVENLRILVELVIMPIISAKVFLWRLAGCSWIPEEKKRIIIRNATDIYSFQITFFTALEKASKEAIDGLTVAPIATCFKKLGKGFKVYTEYCVKHELALQACRELSTKMEWQMFENDSMAQLRQMSLSTKLQFQDFLIKPVQRLCRYQLLLREIDRAISDTIENSKSLKLALDIMHSVVTNINSEKQRQDVALMTTRFIERLEGDWRLNKRSLHMLGNVIYSGALEMLSLHHINQKVKYYGCFLFSTYIVIVRAKKSTVYEPKHWFPLRQFTLQNLKDDEGYLSNSWLLLSGLHAFEFGASCPQEKQVWLKAIGEAINVLQPDTESQREESRNMNQALEEIPESMLVSSLMDPPKAISPKSRSRSMANLKDATSIAATWMHMSTTRSPSILRPTQSYSTPNSAANTPRLSHEMHFSNRQTIDNVPDLSTFSDLLPHEPREGSEDDTRIMGLLPNFPFSPIDSPGKNKLKSPKITHKDSRKAVVDQKLLDVSTQEVLAAKALSARERDMAMARIKRSSFGKVVAKQTVSVDTSEVHISKQTPTSISRRESFEMMAKKLRPRSNDSFLTPVDVAEYALSEANGNQFNQESSQSRSAYDYQQVIHETEKQTEVQMEVQNAAASPGFFEKVIDKFSAMSTPHRQRPPAIKTNFNNVKRSTSMRMLFSGSPTSASSNSSTGMDSLTGKEETGRHEPDQLHARKSVEHVEDVMTKSNRTSRPSSSTSEREGSKLAAWIRTPVTRRRKDSRMK